jgi:hypothetical protein
MEQVDKSVLTPLMTCIPSPRKPSSAFLGLSVSQLKKIVYFVYINNTFAWISKMVPQVKRRIKKEENDT